MLMQCCASKELCSGDMTRTCEKPIDNYYCKKGIIKGAAYWREFDLMIKRFDCSKEVSHDEIKFCFCSSFGNI